MGHIKMMKLKKRSKKLYALLKKEMPDEKKAGDKTEKELEKSINEIDREIKTEGDSSVVWKDEGDDKRFRAIYNHLLKGAQEYRVTNNQTVKQNLDLLERLAKHFEGEKPINDQEIKGLTREEILSKIIETRKIILEAKKIVDDREKIIGHFED